MAFELAQDDPLMPAARRIAAEQVDGALAALAGLPGQDPAATVHAVRKACKRVRGLVRLVRPLLGDHFGEANAAARDAARALSSIRDAQAVLETLDLVLVPAATAGDGTDRGDLATVRTHLAGRAAAAASGLSPADARVRAAAAHLAHLRAAIDDWPDDVDAAATREAIATGVARTATRARARFVEVAMLADEVPAATSGQDGARPADASAGSDDELLHQWRKRVKYSWYHVALLEPAAPALLGAHVDALHDLGGLLGDDHDLAVLADRLVANPDDHGGEAAVASTLALVTRVRSRLQQRAVVAGARLHAEDPVAFGQRLAALHAAAALWPAAVDPDGADQDLAARTNGELRALARARDLPDRTDLDRAGLLAALG